MLNKKKNIGNKTKYTYISSIQDKTRVENDSPIVDNIHVYQLDVFMIKVLIYFSLSDVYPIVMILIVNINFRASKKLRDALDWQIKSRLILWL